MSDELTPHQLLAAPVAQPETPDLDEIQGDVLIGLQKLWQRFIFFQITDVAAFKQALRQRIAHRITTTHQVQEREFQLRDLKAHGHGAQNPIPNIGVNVSFTHDGIAKLTANPDLGDPSFDKGAVAQAPSLGDPTAGGALTTWLPAFLSGKIDGVFFITGGTQHDVDFAGKKILKVLDHAVSVVHDQDGKVRPGAEKGHEHFGFLDGISQPGIQGLAQPFPGQRVLEPGHFVFGYPGQPTNPPQAWMVNGSFMVFRRLNQLVPEFDQFLLSAAAVESGGQPAAMDPVLLGARMVGRWKSGAPLALTPLQDDLTIGPDPQQNNHFDFSDDQLQRRCPFGAHIRKTNPRADRLPQENAVDPHRIIRAGIPFGEEVSAAEAAAGKTDQERGLMFVCYQTSIVNQFEFLQKIWANNPNFVSPAFPKQHPDGSTVNVGFDPIIGQNGAAGQNRARTTDEAIPNYPVGNVRSTLKEPNDFIVPTGGAYFFVPSITALLQDLSA